MHYSEAEISDLALYQLIPSQTCDAVAAFNGFADVFGRNWIDDYFRLGKSPRFVLHIVDLWKDWRLIQTLAGARELLRRWKEGFDAQGVQAEIRTAVALLRQGLTVELFPESDNRKPDCRFHDGKAWIYVEISTRGLSRIKEQGMKILAALAERAARAAVGGHGKVGILRFPSPNELDDILSWLQNLGNQREARLNDLAIFRREDLDDVDDDDLRNLIHPPRLACTVISADRLRGTAFLQISDNAAQRIVDVEASQLSSDDPGVLVLDVSQVIGGYKEWIPLVERRFQPTINRKISAVVLVETTLGYSGLETQGQVLINPHARKSLSQRTVTFLEGIVSQALK